MATKKALEYNSDSIETLRFPENVRKNASMYLGSVDAAGVWLCNRELLDNIIDEAMAGRASSAWLHLDKDGSYWVCDDGAGVPQGMQPFTVHVNGKNVKSRMPTMQAVFGELHTSGKYRSDAYATSVGSHGIGAKGTNATAEFFKVYTFYEGKWFNIEFKKGIITKEVAPCAAPKGPDGKIVKRGTMIHFKPDSTIFTVKSFPPSLAVEWSRIMSYINPGFTIRISSPKNDKKFMSKDGLAEYLRMRLLEIKAEAETVTFGYKSDLADIIVAFSNYDGCDLRGFTNGLTNTQGGKHVDSVNAALFKSVSEFKQKKQEFTASDFRDGLVGLVNAKLHKAQFSSQDKAKLTDARVGAEFEKTVLIQAKKFFAANKALAGRLCERAAKINELKKKFTAGKAVATALNKLKKEGMPHNYSAPDARTKVEDRELFIVEGDSAAGGVRKTKNKWQGLLPMTGKVLNVMRAKSTDAALASKGIVNILGAIGFDPKAVDPYAKLTVGKIICLADPDPDGPFIGDTVISCRFPEDPSDIGRESNDYPIARLADHTTNGNKFEVPVFHQGKKIWAPATAQLVKNVDKLMAFEIGRSKFRVDEGHKWVCIMTRAMYGRETEPHPEHDKLVYVKAKDMKVGDRVWCPANNHMKDPALTDKETGLGYQAVSKLRVQELKELVPVYCLTVPRYHSFILPSGVVSSNCHINSLLLTLFYKMVPDLFNRGMVYVADIPEFYTVYKAQLIMGDTVSDIQTKLKKAGAPASHGVSHAKGWGEVDASLMRLLAVESTSRRLIQIKAIEHEDKTDFVRIMNEDVDYRRVMLNLPTEMAPDKPVGRRTAAVVSEGDDMIAPDIKKTRVVVKTKPKMVRTGKVNTRKAVSRTSAAF